MRRQYNSFFVVVLLFVLLKGCGGLDPTALPEQTTVIGAVEFVGGEEAWPPADSVFEVRVVGFVSFPPEDLVSDVLSGRAYFSEEINLFTDFSTYRIELPEPPPARFEYLAVALRYGTDFFTDWRVIGVFSTPDNHKEHIPYEITPATVNTANIRVIFDDLPPQPFE